MKRVAVVAAVLILVGLLAWRIHQAVSTPPGPERPAGMTAAVAVVVEPVRRETIRDVRVLTGTLRAREQFDVAPKVPGRLEKLLVNIGSEVRNGDPIAVLDSQEYSQQVEQARAELDVARAVVVETRSPLAVAEREFERSKALRQEKIASEAELDQVEARYRAAQANQEVALAQVKQREAALKAAEVRLSYTRIVAAWEDGTGTRVVGERYVDGCAGATPRGRRRGRRMAKSDPHRARERSARRPDVGQQAVRQEHRGGRPARPEGNRADQPGYPAASRHTDPRHVRLHPAFDHECGPRGDVRGALRGPGAARVPAQHPQHRRHRRRHADFHRRHLHAGVLRRLHAEPGVARRPGPRRGHARGQLDRGTREHPPAARG